MTKPADGSAASVDVNKSGAFMIPKSESEPSQTLAPEAPKAVDINATALNQVTEMQPVPQAASVVENAVRPPNITETSDHPLAAGTSYAELQAQLAASQAKTEQVLLPQKPATEVAKTGLFDKLPKWLRFGK